MVTEEPTKLLYKRVLLKISGEANDFSAIMKYLERLKDGEALTEVRLVNHEVVSRPNANAIRFELNATWRLPA